MESALGTLRLEIGEWGDMGASAIVIGAVALASGLICLFLGYMWGRSNVRSQVESALDQARVSADAREFALREQLEEMMVELSKFRARAEESPARLHEPPAQSKSQRVQGSASGAATAEEPGEAVQATQKLPWQKHQPTPAPAPPVESTDKTIQNLLKSMEEKLKQPEAAPRPVPQQTTPPPRPAPPVEAPRVVPQKVAPPPPATKLPAEASPVVTHKGTPPPPPTPKLPVEEPRAVTPKSAPPPVPKINLPTEKPLAATRPAPRPPAKPPTPGPSPAAKDEWQEFAASLEALTRAKK